LIWKIWAPLKVKIFLWLALKRRHWTADRRHRHGLDAQTICSLCGMEPETNDHLFLSCSYTRQVWAVTSHHIGGQWPNLLGIGTLEVARRKRALVRAEEKRFRHTRRADHLGGLEREKCTSV
jgi:hypothetical protein